MAFATGFHTRNTPFQMLSSLSVHLGASIVVRDLISDEVLRPFLFRKRFTLIDGLVPLDSMYVRRPR